MISQLPILFAAKISRAVPIQTANINLKKVLGQTLHSMPPKKSKNKANKQANNETKKIVDKSPIREDSDKNVLIEIYAKPGAKQNAITDATAEGINIQINAPPVEGSANTELIKYIASFLGVKSSCVSLERGHKARNKVLKVSGNISRKDVVIKVNAELPAGSKLLQED